MIRKFGGGFRRWSEAMVLRDNEGQFANKPDYYIPPSRNRAARRTAKVHHWETAKPWVNPPPMSAYEQDSMMTGGVMSLRSAGSYPRYFSPLQDDPPIWFNDGDLTVGPRWWDMSEDERRSELYRSAYIDSVYASGDVYPSIEGDDPRAVAAAAYAAMATGEANDVDEAAPGLLPVVRREAVAAGLPVDDGFIAPPVKGDERFAWGLVPDVPAPPQFELYDDYEKYRRDKDRWEETVRQAVATGELPAVDGYALHALEGREEEWHAAPPKLYHVTTAVDSVVANGLQTREQLSMERGLGLGGGPSNAVSFTDNYEAAESIYKAMLEAQSFAAGNLTLDDLLAQDRDDAWGLGPGVVARSLAESYPLWGDGAPIAEGQDGDALWDRYREFTAMRAHAGGPMDPLFSSTDWEGLGRIDPASIAIVEASTVPGAQGQALGAAGLHEWRLHPAAIDGIERAIRPEVDGLGPRSTLYRGLQLGEVSPEDLAAIAADPTAWMADGEVLNVDKLGEHWTSDFNIASTYARWGALEPSEAPADEGSGWELGITVQASVPVSGILVPGTREWQDIADSDGIFGPEHPEAESTVDPGTDIRIEGIWLTATSPDGETVEEQIDLDRLALLTPPPVPPAPPIEKIKEPSGQYRMELGDPIVTRSLALTAEDFDPEMERLSADEIEMLTQGDYEDEDGNEREELVEEMERFADGLLTARMPEGYESLFSDQVWFERMQVWGNRDGGFNEHLFTIDQAGIDIESQDAFTPEMLRTVSMLRMEAFPGYVGDDISFTHDSSLIPPLYGAEAAAWAQNIQEDYAYMDNAGVRRDALMQIQGEAPMNPTLSLAELVAAHPEAVEGLPDRIHTKINVSGYRDAFRAMAVEDLAARNAALADAQAEARERVMAEFGEGSTRTLQELRQEKLANRYGEAMLAEVKWHQEHLQGPPLVAIPSMVDDGEGDYEEVFQQFSDAAYEHFSSAPLPQVEMMKTVERGDPEWDPTGPFEQRVGTGEFSDLQVNVEDLSIDSDGEITLSAVFTTEDGDVVGETTRRIDTANGSVYNALLALAPQIQGQGVGNAWNRHNEAWFLANGITKVEVNASLDEGGYAWASDFFDMDPAVKDRFENRIEREAQGVLANPDATAADTISALQVMADLKHADEEGLELTPWEVAHLGYHDSLKQQRSWLGRQVMKGSDWHGKKDLKALVEEGTGKTLELPSYTPDHESWTPAWQEYESFEDSPDAYRAWLEHRAPDVEIRPGVHDRTMEVDGVEVFATYKDDMTGSSPYIDASELSVDNAAPLLRGATMDLRAGTAETDEFVMVLKDKGTATDTLNEMLSSIEGEVGPRSMQGSEWGLDIVDLPDGRAAVVSYMTTPEVLALQRYLSIDASQPEVMFDAEHAGHPRWGFVPPLEGERSPGRIDWRTEDGSPAVTAITTEDGFWRVEFPEGTPLSQSEKANLVGLLAPRRGFGVGSRGPLSNRGVIVDLGQVGDLASMRNLTFGVPSIVVSHPSGRQDFVAEGNTSIPEEVHFTIPGWTSGPGGARLGDGVVAQWRTSVSDDGLVGRSVLDFTDPDGMVDFDAAKRTVTNLVTTQETLGLADQTGTARWDRFEIETGDRATASEVVAWVRDNNDALPPNAYSYNDDGVITIDLHAEPEPSPIEPMKNFAGSSEARRAFDRQVTEWDFASHPDREGGVGLDLLAGVDVVPLEGDDGEWDLTLEGRLADPDQVDRTIRVLSGYADYYNTQAAAQGMPDRITYIRPGVGLNPDFLERMAGLYPGDYDEGETPERRGWMKV